MFLSDRLRDVFNRMAETSTGQQYRLTSAFLTKHYDTWYRPGGGWTNTGSYLDYDGVSMSYLPASKSDAHGGDPWGSSVRVSGRVGRVLKKFLADLGIVDYSHGDLETMVNAVFSAFAAESKEVELDIVSGHDIAYAYDDDDGPDSCMQNMGFCMDIYTNNPQSIRLIVAYHNEKLSGRALIFNIGNDRWYLDGRYGDDKYRQAILDYANEQGFITDSLPYNSVVNVRATEYESYPYMDTFRYYSMFTGELRPSQFDGWTHSLGSTGGDASDINFGTCGHCGENVTNDELYYTGGEYWCETCQDDHRCNKCGDFDTRLEEGLCPYCVADFTCQDCEEVGRDDLSDLGGVCTSCKEHYACKECKQWQGENLTYRDGLCPECWRADVGIVPAPPCGVAAPPAKPRRGLTWVGIGDILALPPNWSGQV